MNNSLDISGKVIRGFQVVKPIGQGKFSVVYRAESKLDNTSVALKMIKIFDMMDPKQRDKCLKEVRLLESLDHPNIIKYLDSFIEDNQLFIAIEWAEKGDLKNLIKKGISEDLPFDERKIWEYLYQIASALKHMQEKRIMHRDLKPANIFLVADGTLKLGDLGLGRFMSSQTIEAFSRVGTPLYMSPEVLTGNGYDWKSDVWSLGCVVYEMACFRSPFKKEDQKMSLYDLFQTISKGEFPPLPPKYSEELKQVVNLMIQVRPENRLSIEQVVELCEVQLKAIVKKHRVDPFLIMDDIHEKLKLLDYEELFCKPTNRSPITRVYFAHETNKTEQLRYFSDLARWIMSLKNPKQTPLYLGVRTDVEKIVNGVINDAKNYGVRIPDYVTAETLKTGYGDAVCFLVNDLLNRELLRRDYRFETPVIIENGVECYGDPPEAIGIFEEISSGVEFAWDNLEFIEKEVTNDINIEEGVNEELDVLIDPKDWAVEVHRVSSKLELEVIPERQPRSLIKELYIRVQEFVNSGGPKVLLVKADEIDEDLNRISRLEKRMQKEYCDDVKVVKDSSWSQEDLAERYKEKLARVEALGEELKRIERRLEGLAEVNTGNHNNGKMIKQEIRRLNAEILTIDRRCGLLRALNDYFYVNSLTKY